MASASRKAGLKGPDWKCHLLLPDKMPFGPPFLCLHSVAWPLARFLHLIDDSPLSVVKWVYLPLRRAAGEAKMGCRIFFSGCKLWTFYSFKSHLETGAALCLRNQELI